MPFSEPEQIGADNGSAIQAVLPWARSLSGAVQGCGAGEETARGSQPPVWYNSAPPLPERFVRALPVLGRAGWGLSCWMCCFLPGFPSGLKRSDVVLLLSIGQTSHKSQRRGNVSTRHRGITTTYGIP